MAPVKQLIPLLQQASAKLLSLGHSDIYGSSDYTDDLGHLCQTAADKLKVGQLSEEEVKRLYLIFAPTTEWDDSVGDVDLGHAIFTLLNQLYGPILKT